MQRDHITGPTKFPLIAIIGSLQGTTDTTSTSSHLYILTRNDLLCRLSICFLKFEVNPTGTACWHTCNAYG